MPSSISKISDKVSKLLNDKPEIVEALQNPQNNPMLIMAKALKENKLLESNKLFGHKYKITEAECAGIVNLHGDAIYEYEVSKETSMSKILTGELGKNIRYEEVTCLNLSLAPKIIEAEVLKKVEERVKLEIKVALGRELEYQKQLELRKLLNLQIRRNPGLAPPQTNFW